MIIVLAAVCGVFAVLLVFDILVRNTRYAVFLYYETIANVILLYSHQW